MSIFIGKGFLSKKTFSPEVKPAKEYFCDFDYQGNLISGASVEIDWKNQKVTLWMLSEYPNTLKEVLDSPPILKTEFTQDLNVILFEHPNKFHRDLKLLNNTNITSPNEEINLSGKILYKKRCPWDKDFFPNQINHLLSQKSAWLFCDFSKITGSAIFIFFNLEKNSFQIWGAPSANNWNIFIKDPIERGTFKIEGKKIILTGETLKNLDILRMEKGKVLELKNEKGDLILDEKSCPLISPPKKSRIFTKKENFYCSKITNPQGMNSVIHLDLKNKHFEYFSNSLFLSDGPMEKGDIEVSGSHINFNGQKQKFKGELQDKLLLIEKKMEYKKENCTF